MHLACNYTLKYFFCKVIGLLILTALSWTCPMGQMSSAVPLTVTVTFCVVGPNSGAPCQYSDGKNGVCIDVSGNSAASSSSSGSGDISSDIVCNCFYAISPTLNGLFCNAVHSLLAVVYTM